jgi:hypothetical protein
MLHSIPHIQFMTIIDSRTLYVNTPNIKKYGNRKAYGWTDVNVRTDGLNLVPFSHYLPSGFERVVNVYEK